MDQCAFCPTVAELSGEHVWDRWLSKVYAKEVNLKKFRLVEYDSGGSELESKTTQQINRKARVVCEPCNNGWMSVLTNETRSVAKDMIVRGSEIKLVPTDLSTLAQFAFLKSVVIDHLAVGRQPFWPTSDRYAFRTKRLIPASVQVWISSYFHTHAEGHVWSGYAQPKDAGFVGLEFHSFTYHTGCLVLQVMSKRWSKLSRRREVVPTFRQNLLGSRDRRYLAGLLAPDQVAASEGPRTARPESAVSGSMAHAQDGQGSAFAAAQA